ncbi:MAG: peptidylprolyl isomerase [Candidatus Scalindua sp.]|nr:peptidylprolyl isomerase [Candidatus Scalindua sp.]
MKTKIIITLLSFGFLLPLINGCGKSDDKGHYSSSGPTNLNFEQQALKMEADDLAKLNKGKDPHDFAESDGKYDLAKIHEGLDFKHDPNEVIAVVNGENILRIELDRIVGKIKDKASRSGMRLIENQILKDLITQVLLKQFIKKENITVDPARVEEEIKIYRENLKKNPETQDKSLEEILEDQGGSIDELRVALDISFSIDDYLNKTTTEDDLIKHFNENLSAFRGETVTVSHIFLDTRNLKDEESLTKVKEQIGTIKAELDKGADFVELVEKYSECPSAQNGGELGTITRKEMTKSFTDAAFAMDVNTISDPVKTEYGYHILKVSDKQEGKDVTFEEVRDKVKTTLFNGKTIELIGNLTKNANTEILLTEPSGGHGSMHGSASPHGGEYGASPHGGMQGVAPSGTSEHGSLGGVHQEMKPKPIGKSKEETIEDTFSLTH